MMWTARLIYRAEDLTPEELQLIRGALERRATVEHDPAAGRLHLTLDVDADTLGDAATQALRTVGKAPRRAAARRRLHPERAIRLDVMARDFAGTATGEPAPLDRDLMRITDIAELLHLSRQRVGQLASQDPDFPPAVALIGRRGQAYSRQAVEAYAQRRDPRAGRPTRT
jgi:hypothetical protein